MTIYSGVRTVPGAILRDHAGIERQLSSATNFRFAAIPPDRIVPSHERLVLADCSRSRCRCEGRKQTSAPTVAEHGPADEQQPLFKFLSAGSPTVLAARNTFVARRRQQAFKLLLERV
ncbi:MULTISPECIES: hypothetical protein [unclassified Variovorax]|uniref:hypothetical protein n=1 Tax=unclassified Variovorax TaxID=663243 RepID=UPI001160CB73|nr:MULTISPECIES: hypothetical protein [unclassified Variovorax]